MSGLRSQPASRFVAGTPRLHYLEWNPSGAETIVLVHGNSANAWWWKQMAVLMPSRYRLIAVDLRGHGDSEWVRPAAYSPADYARDIARLMGECELERPIVVGHSLGGISVVAFTERFGAHARAAVAIDLAVTSSHARDRYLRRLKALPTVTYPDLETARKRFRLTPSEGEIPQAILAEIAERSLACTEHGRYTLKFDRESFFKGDGLDVLGAIRSLRVPLLLIRGERSRIMTAEGAQRAVESNPRARLKVIAGAHHHLPLERPDELARLIEEFAGGL